MPANGLFDAKVKVELSQCGPLSTLTETSLVGQLHCHEVACVTVGYISEDDTQLVCRAVTIKPGCLPEDRLFVICPLFVTLEPIKKDGNDQPWVESELDGVIDRDALADKLRFQVEENLDPNAPCNVETGFGLGRTQAFYDGLVTMLLGEKKTARLCFQFTPSQMCNDIDPLLTLEARKKYYAVKNVGVQVIAAYSDRITSSATYGTR